MADDLPLSDDVLAIRAEAQKAVDREIAARVELQAAIDNRVDVRAKIADGDAAALAYIDAYVNPHVDNPPTPIAPEVAAPPPAEEPPVFTDVTTPVVAPENSSGGQADVHEDLEVTAPEPVPAG